MPQRTPSGRSIAILASWRYASRCAPTYFEEYSRHYHFGIRKAKIDININIFEESGIKVLNGRYGPYVTNGKVNVTIPKDIEPKSLDEDKCIEMIKNAPPKRKGKRRFRARKT